MRKNFVARDRSLTSLPSKQFSLTDMLTERQSHYKKLIPRSKILQPQKSKEFYDKEKQEEIGKLRKNLESAVSTAVQERIFSSRAVREVTFVNQTKHWLQSKITNLQAEIIQHKQKNSILEKRNAEFDSLKQKYVSQTVNLALKIQEKDKQIQSMSEQLKNLRLSTKKLENLTNMQRRIKTLERQIREEKILSKQVNRSNDEIRKENEHLKQQILRNKPEKQELRQRIAYFERVNLDLSRKMEDYNRRQNDYIKQINNLKSSLAKMTADRNKFKQNYEETSRILEQTQKQCEQHKKQILQKKGKIQNLEASLAKVRARVAELQKQLKDTIDFYKQQTEQNAFLKKRNKLYMEHESEMKNTINHYIEISEEVNLAIVQKTTQIDKLTKQNKLLIEKLEENNEKFEKFDKLFEDGSNKSTTALKQSVYKHIRDNSKLELELKDVKEEMNQKFLLFGQQRDQLKRKFQILDSPYPSQEQFYQSMFRQKAEELILLQKSNDQLLKLKKDVENQVKELEQAVENQKKEVYVLRLKASQLFKTKRDLEQSKKNCERYQQMIHQQDQSIQDLQSQLAILREKLARSDDKNFTLDLENRNANIRIKQLEQILKELDVSVLEDAKARNQKNAHFLNDALEKLTNGIKSLSYFFMCSFCGKYPLNPVTLANCGHNYCEKCKEAYQQSCYECDTGIPIEKIFHNKFLKQCSGKYRFLCMVVTETKDKFVKQFQ